jgi:DnaJ-class molecular chaperone
MGDIEMTTTRKICPNCHELGYVYTCPECRGNGCLDGIIPDDLSELLPCTTCHGELEYDVCPNCGLGDVKRRPDYGANMPMPRTAPREFYEKQMRDYLAWHKRFYRKSE